MIKNGIGFLYIFLILPFGAKGATLLNGIIASPCGCGIVQGGRDATQVSFNDEVALMGFKRCLRCPNIKEFPHIAPYLRAFLNQLPENNYDVYRQTLQTLPWGPQRNLSYADVIVGKDQETWGYTDGFYGQLTMTGTLLKEAKVAQGSNRHLWNFLYYLGHGKKNRALLPRGSQRISLASPPRTEPLMRGHMGAWPGMPMHPIETTIKIS